MSSNEEAITASISVGSTVSSFFLSAIPVLQFFALVVGIIAGLITIYKHIKGEKK